MGSWDDTYHEEERHEEGRRLIDSRGKIRTLVVLR